MKVTTETKLFLGILLATAVLIAGAAFLLSKPQPKINRDQLILSDTPVVGNPNAAAYLVEFSDFQCPACKAFQPVVDDIVAKHKDRLLFAYRHFPLPQHKFADAAARAAQAADLQGKFWEMERLIFANQENFSDSLWLSLAKELGLDVKKFQDDFSSSTVAGVVERDRNDGITIGVTSTPTFFLNGKKLVNLTSFDELKQRVEQELEP